MRVIILLFVVIFFHGVSASADTVYRYKDKQGRWTFSDKKPKESHDTLNLKPQTKEQEKPKLYVAQVGEKKVLMFNNPWFAPVTFGLLDKGEVVYTWLAEPRSDQPVFKTADDAIAIVSDALNFRFTLGAVIAGSDLKALRPPVPKTGKYKVTQGFMGHFSHNQPGSRYAIDIAMDMDDQIHAARAGVVVFVKDDYHMGGASQFFIDKANHVTIYHSDGTFGLYGHILLGSALVKPGDRVDAGAPLANAGTSGYSTGPHLHFVVQFNSGEKLLSTPFEFENGSGSSQPVLNQWLRVKR